MNPTGGPRVHSDVEALLAVQADDAGILDVVFATREPAKHGLKELADFIEYGASPRATIALTQASSTVPG